MRLRWKVKTSDTMNSGTDADVFLGLAGLDAVMREVEISDPGAVNDWERGDINTGIIETEDLGELQSGTLRHNGSGPTPGWSVDWVKIQSEEDGREWTATVGQFDDGGRFPVLRFSQTDAGQYAQVQRQKQRQAQVQLDKDAKDKSAREAVEDKEKDDADERTAQRELEKQRKLLDIELKKAKQEAELLKVRSEIDKLRSGGTTAPTGTSGTGNTTGFRTYELFGILNGMNVPLAQVVTGDRNTGRYTVVAGGRVIVGEQANEGYGLGGLPGRWQMYYSGRSPSEFGLDADKGVLGSDGSRGWALNAQFLAQVFGTNWRASIYS